jgi:hypothetical protein
MINQCMKELSKEQIHQIRLRYATEDCNMKQLAEEFGVTVYQIKKILEGVPKWRPSVLQRFNEKWTEDENGCHIWNACVDKDGYGLFKMDDKSMRANRVSYLLYKGEIPKGVKVRHTCDNPACVNPAHLILGTQGQNNQDKIDRFRQPWQFESIEYLEMRSLIQLGVHEDAIVERSGINKDTLRNRLDDMVKTDHDPAKDRVHYYRDRAIFEEQQSTQERFNPVHITRVIE